MASSRLDVLAAYSACDVSDALMKLDSPGAGYLADIGPITRFLPQHQAFGPNYSGQIGVSPSPYPPRTETNTSAQPPYRLGEGSEAVQDGKHGAPPGAYPPTQAPYPQQQQQQHQQNQANQKHGPSAAQPSINRSGKLIARASTILFTPYSSPSFPNESSVTSSLAGIIKNAFLLPDSNIESGTPYSDLTIPDTIVVVSQPEGQVCAVVGGIHAVRMKILGARGVLVDGRVRDLSTLVELGIPVWSKATSTIGSAAEARAWAAGVPVKVGAVTVNPGDIIMIDPAENGAVCIPSELLEEVLELLPKLTANDEKVMVDVGAGLTVKDAFKRHRQ